MNITAADLQGFFATAGTGMPGAMQAAQIVGGNAIPGMPPVTRNAPAMTRYLAGQTAPPAPTVAQAKSGDWNVLGSVGQTIGTFPTQQAAQAGVSDAPSGSKARPFYIEIGSECSRNLAKEIGEAQKRKESEKPLSPMQQALKPLTDVLGAFGRGHKAGKEALAGKTPLGMVKNYAAGKIKNWLNIKDPEPAAAEAAPKNWALESAQKNAKLLSRFGKGGKLSAEQDPFGTLAGGPREEMQANIGRKVAESDLWSASGQGSAKGWSQRIAPPPVPPATPAAGAVSAETGLSATTGAKTGTALEGLADAAGTATSTVSAVVMGYAELVGAMFGAVKGIQAFGQAQLEGYRESQRFNGGLAVMFAQLDRQKLVLQARYAANTGGTAAALGEQQQQLNESMQGLSEDLGNIKNTAVTGLVMVGRGLMEVLNVIAIPLHYVSEFCTWLMGSGNATERSPMGMLIGRMANDHLNQGAKPGHFKVQRPGGHR